MGRRSIELTIPADTPDNRDAGKTYVLTEMPASQAEDWAVRALSAAVKGGAELPADPMSMGLLGLSFMGISGILNSPHELVKPLLAEMMECVTIKPSGNIMRKLVEDDTEEVSTRLLLRDKLLELHVGFSPAAILSRAAAEAKAARDAFLNTPTSVDESAPLSAPDSPPSTS